VEKLFTLAPDAFAPPPKVHSSVLRLTVEPRFHELRVKPEPFIEFLKQNFAQKRKTLVNNLRGIYQQDHVRAALKGAGARPDVRAEALTLEKAAAIFRELWQGRPGG
jgi:16S rRNA (adenine1518-N6/adenine1519-N6)-dimethyltransferase